MILRPVDHRRLWLVCAEGYHSYPVLVLLFCIDLLRRFTSTNKKRFPYRKQFFIMQFFHTFPTPTKIPEALNQVKPVSDFLQGVIYRIFFICNIIKRPELKVNGLVYRGVAILLPDVGAVCVLGPLVK